MDVLRSHYYYLPVYTYVFLLLCKIIGLGVRNLLMPHDDQVSDNKRCGGLSWNDVMFFDLMTGYIDIAS